MLASVSSNRIGREVYFVVNNVFSLKHSVKGFHVCTLMSTPNMSFVPVPDTKLFHAVNSHSSYLVHG